MRKFLQVEGRKALCIFKCKTLGRLLVRNYAGQKTSKQYLLRNGKKTVNMEEIPFKDKKQSTFTDKQKMRKFTAS